MFPRILNHNEDHLGQAVCDIHLSELTEPAFDWRRANISPLYRVSPYGHVSTYTACIYQVAGKGGGGVICSVKENENLLVKFIPERLSFIRILEGVRRIQSIESGFAIEFPMQMPRLLFEYEHVGVYSAYQFMERVPGIDLYMLLYDHHEEGDGTYYYRAFVENSALWVELLCYIANALKEYHDNGLIHRDIKPENIMVSLGVNEHGAPCIERVVIIDPEYTFNVRERFDQDEITPHVMFQDERFYGTPGYFHPLAKMKRYGFRSDIFALGVTSLQMLSGRVVFEFNSETGTSRYFIPERLGRLDILDVRFAFLHDMTIHFFESMMSPFEGVQPDIATVCRYCESLKRVYPFLQYGAEPLSDDGLGAMTTMILAASRCSLAIEDQHYVLGECLEIDGSEEKVSAELVSKFDVIKEAVAYVLEAKLDYTFGQFLAAILGYLKQKRLIATRISPSRLNDPSITEECIILLQCYVSSIALGHSLNELVSLSALSQFGLLGDADLVAVAQSEGALPQDIRDICAQIIFGALGFDFMPLDVNDPRGVISAAAITLYKCGVRDISIYNRFFEKGARIFAMFVDDLNARGWLIIPKVQEALAYADDFYHETAIIKLITSERIHGDDQQRVLKRLSIHNLQELLRSEAVLRSSHIVTILETYYTYVIKSLYKWVELYPLVFALNFFVKEASEHFSMSFALAEVCIHLIKAGYLYAELLHALSCFEIKYLEDASAPPPFHNAYAFYFYLMRDATDDKCQQACSVLRASLFSDLLIYMEEKSKESTSLFLLKARQPAIKLEAANAMLACFDGDQETATFFKLDSVYHEALTGAGKRLCALAAPAYRTLQEIHEEEACDKEEAKEEALEAEDTEEKVATLG